MYEITPGWEPYYEELDAEERAEIFERLLQELPDDGYNAFRKQINETRYPKKGNKDRKMDLFLLNMVYIPGIYSKSISIFSNTGKELRKICTDMGMDKVPLYTEEEKNIVYQELRNAAALYFSTCRDAGYGRKLFGILQASEDERAAQACSEAWILSRGVPKISGMQEELRVFSAAILDAYYLYDKKAKKRFEEYEERQKQRMSEKKKGWFGR